MNLSGARDLDPGLGGSSVESQVAQRATLIAFALRARGAIAMHGSGRDTGTSLLMSQRGVAERHAFAHEQTERYSKRSSGQALTRITAA